ncbi:MAG: family transporter [Candidatus Saccharibacteria bacterium]|nr:family transporter [Candidatus Saccharibacteria bacterium]
MKDSKSSPSNIPHRLDYIAGISWRLLAIIGVVIVFIFIIIELKIIVIPFLVALLVTALLFPLVQWLNKKGVKKGLAVAISLVLMIIIVSTLVFIVTKQIQGAYPALKQQFEASLSGARTTLSNEPFNIDASQINQYQQDALNYAQENSKVLLSGLSSVGVTAGHVLAGIFLALFSVIFLLLDGKNIWRWVVNLFPKTSRERILTAGFRGWRTLISFVKSQVIVAGVDALGIGLGALILQVPLAIPIAVMVFLGSFIPVVGAVVTGLIAVVVAFIFNGWLAALLMLGVVLIVQLIEGHVLQPFLIGKAVEIHPLAVVLAVAIGSLLAGIPGALFAVPITAVLNVMAVTLLGDKTSSNSAKSA